MTKPLPSLMPAMYSHRVSEIQAIAKEHGYALAVHGSMQRDLDLIAVPWVQGASPDGVLIEALIDGLGVTFDSAETDKPHGRKAVTLGMGGCCFMDLSIMPIVENQG